MFTKLFMVEEKTNYSFLKEVAKDLLHQHSNNISELKLVLPTRRAELFFTEYLSNLLKKPIWQPQYVSLEQITQLYSNLTKADNFTLIGSLYKVYKKHTNTSEDFNHFFFWGEIMLADFDAIDRNLVDAQMLFRNLLNQKDLTGDLSFLSAEQIAYIQSFWESFSVEKDKLQNQFIEIWEVLYTVYKEFKENLKERNLAYTGMIFRDMVENLDTLESTDKYVFVGFNILSKSEKLLFSKLRKQGRASFYWDYDNYYIENKQQEAGLFIRENIKEFPAPTSFKTQSTIATAKDVNIICVPSEVLQTKLLPKLLHEMGAEYNNRTAIVLMDESLLMPCLYSLPKDVQDVNVTLGYPLANTPVFSLVELLISLQLSYKEFSTQVGFYYKHVLELIQHKYIRTIAPKDVEEITNYIHLNNRVYVNESLFKNSFLKSVFKPLSVNQELIAYINKILMHIAYADFETNESELLLRREYIFIVHKELNKLLKSIEEEKLSVSINVVASLIREVFRKTKVPFEGEPIKGLQIMGLKETRALDFDNVILLSANEDLLPSTNKSPSLIPYNLRKAYGLPNIEGNEAVTAYYFYRLLQSTTAIRLVYSSKSNENVSGEMSRYLYQLKYELPYTITESFVDYKLGFNSPTEILVEKRGEVLEKLKQWLNSENGLSLSPSSIATYLTCPLQFYFNKIAEIKPKEKVQEEIPMNVLGSILHEVMEEIYKPYINNILNRELIKGIKQNKSRIKHLVEKAFSKHFYNSTGLPEDFNENGKLLIVAEVIQKYINGILLYDYKNSDFLMLASEKRHTGTLAITVDNRQVSVKLGGIIDRVDKHKGSIRIIDYKTGAGRGVNKRLRFSGIESLFSNNPEIHNREVLQTLIYSVIYSQENPLDHTPIIPALYFVRDSYSKNFSYILKDSQGISVYNSRDYIPELTQRLSLLLEELFNKDVPFTQTQYTHNCTFCNFKLICNRL